MIANRKHDVDLGKVCLILNNTLGFSEEVRLAKDVAFHLLFLFHEDIFFIRCGAMSADGRRKII